MWVLPGFWPLCFQTQTKYPHCQVVSALDFQLQVMGLSPAVGEMLFKPKYCIFAQSPS